MRVSKINSDDGDRKEVVLHRIKKFKIETYLPIIDKLQVELFRHMKAYNNMYYIFGFLI